MKLATVTSACECQARLSAELDENQCVVRGFASDRRRGKTRSAPAHTIEPKAESFQIAWACSLCGRNTVRSFDAGGLAFIEQAPRS
ncbi:MAG: hypothetical protein IPI67_18625 [Myxococcales bacterium]|nr:hypothetical protein [Myxococcales bacterium]